MNEIIAGTHEKINSWLGHNLSSHTDNGLLVCANENLRIARAELLKAGDAPVNLPPKTGALLCEFNDTANQMFSIVSHSAFAREVAYAAGGLAHTIEATAMVNRLAKAGKDIGAAVENDANYKEVKQVVEKCRKAGSAEPDAVAARARATHVIAVAKGIRLQDRTP